MIRIVDIILSSVLLALLMPVLILTILALAVMQKGQVFFIQYRPGHKEKLFKILKFKTMQDLYSNSGELLPDSERLTAIGKIVRALSLDELPQLINVLKGDMSLVGPRPLLPEYLPLYSDTQRRRHDVKPGITGWAQINGRNAVTWQQRFNYDVWFVDNYSLSLYFRILLMTIGKVFKREGINQSGYVTMTKFKGN